MRLRRLLPSGSMRLLTILTLLATSACAAPAFIGNTGRVAPKGAFRVERLRVPGQHAGRGDRARRPGRRRDPPLEDDDLPGRRRLVLERRRRRARRRRGVPLRARRPALVAHRGVRPLRLRARARRRGPLGPGLEGARPRLAGVRAARRAGGGLGRHAARRRGHAKARDVRRHHRERPSRRRGTHGLPARVRRRPAVAGDRPYVRRRALHAHALEGPGRSRISPIIYDGADAQAKLLGTDASGPRAHDGRRSSARRSATGTCSWAPS